MTCLNGIAKYLLHWPLNLKFKLLFLELSLRSHLVNASTNANVALSIEGLYRGYWALSGPTNMMSYKMMSYFNK